jgi:putative phage-type endonuclease
MNDSSEEQDIFEFLESIQDIYPYEYGFDPYELECFEEELNEYLEEFSIDSEPKNREFIIQVMRYLKIILQQIGATPYPMDDESHREKLEEVFERLYTFQGIQQRSEKWFEIRHNILSASTCKAVMGVNLETSKGMRFIHDRLRDVQVFTGAFNPEKPDSPMVRGTRYEPILRNLYEELNGSKVEEFDCVIHPRIPFIGASPDGIVVGGNHVGRMLEIKCPMPDSVIKDGDVVRLEYWYQMQVQMEVCDLEECDYFRVVVRDFPVIEDAKMFIQGIPPEEIATYGTTWSHPETGKHGHGQSRQWIRKFGIHVDSLVYRHYIILKKDIFQCLVRRNRDWFEDVYLPQATEVWEEILRGREDPNGWDTQHGFEIPMNDIETSQYHSPVDTLTPKGVCLID